jgi:prephenate dehydratase
VEKDAELVPCRSFEEVFDTVKAGTATYGVLPIENSIGGSIHRNYDLLLERDLPLPAKWSCRSFTTFWRCPARTSPG